MKFENTEVYGMKRALFGMRNPKNSWHLADTKEDEDGSIVIGPKDLKLAQALISGGSEHRKFMRQIFVSVDITAPLYFFKEFDTYKVGTVANSTSTMHKITSKPITLDCFEIDDYDTNYASYFFEAQVIPRLEGLRQQYLETKDKKYWKELIRWLPESWLQTRTVTMNYENLRAIYFQRKNHKLNEWSGLDKIESDNFIDWIKTLPYAEELITWNTMADNMHELQIGFEKLLVQLKAYRDKNFMSIKDTSYHNISETVESLETMMKN